MRFSDALTADLTTIGEADRTHRCFVGSWGEAGDELGAWAGDEVSVETSYGSIRFAYDVEPRAGDANGKEKERGKGLFGRLLGR